MENVCKYRNCNKTLEGMSGGAQFCCRNHKSNENNYRRRKKVLLNKYKETAMKQIELVKFLRAI